MFSDYKYQRQWCILLYRKETPNLRVLPILGPYSKEEADLIGRAVHDKYHDLTVVVSPLEVWTDTWGAL